MTMLFTWCFLTEWLTFTDLLIMTLVYLPQPLIAGGVMMFLLHWLCPRGKAVSEEKE